MRLSQVSPGFLLSFTEISSHLNLGIRFFSFSLFQLHESQAFVAQALGSHCQPQSCSLENKPSFSWAPGPWAAQPQPGAYLPAWDFPFINSCILRRSHWVFLILPFSLIFSPKSPPGILSLQNTRDLLKLLGSKPLRLYSSESAFPPSALGNFEVSGRF